MRWRPIVGVARLTFAVCVAARSRPRTIQSQARAALLRCRHAPLGVIDEVRVFEMAARHVVVCLAASLDEVLPGRKMDLSNFGFAPEGRKIVELNARFAGHGEAS